MRILGILLCCLMLGLSSVAFAEQLTTVYSKVVATKNMQGEIPEIDGLRYTNLQKMPTVFWQPGSKTCWRRSAAAVRSAMKSN